MMYIISIVIVALDQLVKHLIRTGMTYRQSIPVIKNVLHLSYVKNTGMSFGLFPGVNIVFLVIATIIVLSIVIFERRGKLKTPAERFFFGMILGGAAGNLIDRYLFGFITDFIDFRIFPVFNIADSCICVGAFFLFIIYFKKKPESSGGEDISTEVEVTEPDINTSGNKP